DLLWLLRLWLLQARAENRSHLPAVQEQVRGPLAVGWTGMDDGQPGRAVVAELRHHVRPSSEVDAALDCGRAGPSTEAAAAGYQDVGGMACRRAVQRSCAAPAIQRPHDRRTHDSDWRRSRLLGGAGCGGPG